MENTLSVYELKTCETLNFSQNNEIMIGKNYKLTFTDTAHKLVCKLIGHGFNIRDILNAGVVLFDKSPLEQRGTAIAEAKTNRAQEFEDALSVILKSNTELLSPRKAELAKAIINLVHDNAAQSAAAADEAGHAAQRAAEEQKDKRNHRTA
ncbi:MAG: hypothetical protein LLF76_02950 [Planctomycetaceae bacterium]|nr:hypothetical protein [Planctomycetaceae bacterium]